MNRASEVLALVGTTGSSFSDSTQAIEQALKRPFFWRARAEAVLAEVLLASSAPVGASASAPSQPSSQPVGDSNSAPLALVDPPATLITRVLRVLRKTGYIVLKGGVRVSGNTLLWMARQGPEPPLPLVPIHSFYTDDCCKNKKLFRQLMCNVYGPRVLQEEKAAAAPAALLPAFQGTPYRLGVLWI